MTTTDIWTIVAIVVGPIVSVLVSIFVGKYLSKREERRQQKFLVLSTIVAYQWKPVTVEEVRALNAIDLFFHDVPSVRSAWKELHEAFGRRDLRGADWVENIKKKKLELIHTMARDLGFGKTISHLDLDRIYSPIGLADPSSADLATIEQLIGVLQDRRTQLLSQSSGDSV
jgi:hypothetical protein